MKTHLPLLLLLLLMLLLLMLLLLLLTEVELGSAAAEAAAGGKGERVAAASSSSWTTATGEEVLEHIERIVEPEARSTTLVLLEARLTEAVVLGTGFWVGQHLIGW
jgi:hypothetical protein